MHFFKIFILLIAISFNIGGISHANIFDSLKTIGQVLGGATIATSTPNQMDTLLIDAAKHGNIELAQRALANGAKVNCYVNNTMPLEIAIQNHDFDMANFLLHNGADPEGYILNGKDKHYYIFECNLDMISFLLDWGVNPNIKNNDNQNLINYVIDGSNIYTQAEKLDVINLLISKGVDINNKEHHGMLPWSHFSTEYATPLMQSINDNYNDIFYTLLNAGANIKLKDAHGRTALDYAIGTNNTEIIDKLMTMEGRK